jgi:hypothetical protein
MPDQTISAVSDANQPVNWVERRATVRYPFHQPALWRDNHSQGSVCLWGQVRDISLEGIGLVLKRGMKPGTILIVEFESASRQNTFTVEGQVVYSTLQADGTWRTGCLLKKRLTEQELRALLC